MKKYIVLLSKNLNNSESKRKFNRLLYFMRLIIFFGAIIVISHSEKENVAAPLHVGLNALMQSRRCL